MTEFSYEDIEDAMCCASSQLRDFWAELPPRGQHSSWRSVCCGRTRTSGRSSARFSKGRAKLKFEEWQLKKIHPMMEAFLKDRRVVEFIDGKFKEVA